MGRSLIGKVTTYDLYNDDGLLLLPKHTRLTGENIDWLERHQIELGHDDVINFDANYYKQQINRAVEKSKVAFEEVRHTMKLPMGYIEENMIPAIERITLDIHVVDLFISLQAKDDYTYRHNIAVGALATMVGQWLNLPQDEIAELSLAGFLHDVGKMRIPEEVLNKPGRLTDEEFAFMKKHTVFGYDIIKSTPGTTERQALAALQHHERMDGSGYPEAIRDKKINLFSRIISVVDVFHAITSNRVYRDALPFYQVLQEIDAESFGKLDPYISRIFIEKMMLSLIGHEVCLTDGRRGKIILIQKNDPIRPLVQTEDDFINLSKNREVKIKEVLG